MMKHYKYSMVVEGNDITGYRGRFIDVPVPAQGETG